MAAQTLQKRWKNDAITMTPKLIGWKLKVAHEIKAAGIDIDLNRTVGP
jgi:hypothetical protein